MKYNYSVKVNGKWYRPNEEVPETKTEKVAVSKTENTTKETAKK